MQSPPIFSSAKSKVERANHHIDELDRVFSTFVDSQPYELVVETSDTGEDAVQMKFNKAIPDGLPVIIGDAVNNLRAALDHMTWDAVGRDRGKRDHRLYFPTGSDRVEFESKCEKLQARYFVRSSVVAILKSLEAFPYGRGGVLYALHRLNNADKHRALTPIVGIGKVNFRLIYPNGNVQACSVNVMGTSVPLCALAPFEAGVRVQLNERTRPEPDLNFGRDAGFESVPIIPTLRRMSSVASNAIDRVANA